MQCVVCCEKLTFEQLDLFCDNQKAEAFTFWGNASAFLHLVFLKE
jgi:hypothetical protein